MRRLIAIAQVASLLVGHIVCAPHAHADMAVGGHSHRPHVHLHGPASQGHRHARKGHHHARHVRSMVSRSALAQRSPMFRGKSAAHDADAIYLTTATLAGVRGAGHVDALKSAPAGPIGQVGDDRARGARAADWDHLLRPPNGSLPVYMRTLRLRF